MKGRTRQQQRQPQDPRDCLWPQQVRLVAAAVVVAAVAAVVVVAAAVVVVVVAE